MSYPEDTRAGRLAEVDYGLEVVSNLGVFVRIGLRSHRGDDGIDNHKGDVADGLNSGRQVCQILRGFERAGLAILRLHRPHNLDVLDLRAHADEARLDGIGRLSSDDQMTTIPSLASVPSGHRSPAEMVAAMNSAIVVLRVPGAPAIRASLPRGR